MKILKKILILLLGVFALCMVIFLLGPKVHFDTFNNDPSLGKYTFDELKKVIVTNNEDPDIKPNNHEKIIWSDGVEKTEYSFVYLHGFSASHEEGSPLHTNLAKKFGANLYLTRLPRHGLKDHDAFKELTPGEMVSYAKEAVKIGKSIGEKVILISCSTGSTLSTYLEAADPEIYALVMFSPNFGLYDQTSRVITMPWGLTVARKIKKSNYHEWNAPEKAKPYWYDKYRLEGVAALQSLLNRTMKDEVFASVKQPLFVGYFYKNEEFQDFTISTEKIREFERKIATPEELREFVTYDDGNAHVFISPLFNENWLRVQKDVVQFLEKKVGLVYANENQQSVKYPDIATKY